jgi:hypothetical protein
MTAFAATSSLVFLSNYKSMRGDKAEELWINLWKQNRKLYNEIFVLWWCL